MAVYIFLKFYEIYEKVNTIYLINNSYNIDINGNKESYAIIDLGDDPYDSDINLDAYDINDFEYSKFIEIEKCEELIDELLQCYIMENQMNKKCQKLYEEKVNDLFKCKMVISNFSLENMKKNLINFNLNDNNEDNFDYYFREEDDNLILDDLFKLSKDYNLKEVIEIDDLYFQEEPLIEKKEKENFIIVDKRDCVEYELSKKDSNYIICNKYE